MQFSGQLSIRTKYRISARQDINGSEDGAVAPELHPGYRK
jgi:hypothetical protein